MNIYFEYVYAMDARKLFVQITLAFLLIFIVRKLLLKKSGEYSIG